MTLDKVCKLSVLTAPDRFVTYIARTLKMPEHYIQNIRWISPLACLCLGTWVTSSASAFITSKIGSGFFGGIAQGLIYCVHLPLVQLSTYAPDDFSGKGILSLRNTLADTRLIKILSYVIPVPQKVTEFAAGKPWHWDEEGDPSRISIVAAASCALAMFALARWSKLSAFTMISTAYTIAAVTELCMIHKVNRLGDEQSAFFS